MIYYAAFLLAQRFNDGYHFPVLYANKTKAELLEQQVIETTQMKTCRKREKKLV